MIKTPGYPAQLDLVGVKQNIYATNWKVRFDYKGLAKGNVTLTLGLAAEVNSGLRALINGHEILKLNNFDGPSGDSSLFRQAAHGIFRQQNVVFSATLLKDKNILEFTPPGAVSKNHFDKMVMWDFLRLEVKEA